MLRQLRSEKFRKVLMIALAVIVIPSFIVVYGWQSGPGTGAGPTATAAKIKYGVMDKVEIGQPEMQRGQQFLRSRVGTYAAQQGLQLDEDVVGRMVSTSPRPVLNEAINLALLERYARENGIAVTREEAVQSLQEQIPPQARQYWMDQLRQQGQSLSDVVENYRYNLLLEKVRASLASKVRVTLYEAWLAYALDNMKLTLDTARFDVGRFVDKVEVKPEELQQYFEANQARYQVPEQVQYAFVQVRKDDLRSSVTVSQDEITSAYEELKEEFRLPATAHVRTIFLEKPTPESLETTDTAELTTRTEAARSQAQELFQRAAKGESFEALAEQYSQLKDFPPRDALETTSTDAATTAGGNLGFISETVARNYYGDEWTSAVFTATPGKILPPIETPAGFHVVKVEQVREGQLQPLDRVHEVVRRRVIDRKVEPLFQAAGEKLTSASEEATTLEQIAEATGYPVRLTGKVDRDAVFIPELGLVNEIQAVLADLQKGKRTEEVLTDSNRHLVAELREEFPEHAPTLDEVRERVTQDFRQQKAREMARTAAEQVASKAKDLASLQSAVADTDSTVTTSQPFTPAEAATILGPVQDFQSVAAVLKEGDVRMLPLGPENSPMGYIVFHVSDKTDPEQKEFVKELPRLTNQLMERKREIVMNEYLRDRREELKENIELSEYYRE